MICAATAMWDVVTNTVAIFKMRNEFPVLENTK